MNTHQTPGQIAYEAYLRAWSITGLRTWDDEPRGQQRAWDAAAQAVLVGPEGFRFAVGQHVTWDEAPGATWQIIERRHHEGTERTWRTYDLLPVAVDLTTFRPFSAAETQLHAAEVQGRLPGR